MYKYYLSSILGRGEEEQVMCLDLRGQQIKREI